MHPPQPPLVADRQPSSPNCCSPLRTIQFGTSNQISTRQTGEQHTFAGKDRLTSGEDRHPGLSPTHPRIRFSTFSTLLAPDGSLAGTLAKGLGRELGCIARFLSQDCGRGGGWAAAQGRGGGMPFGMPVAGVSWSVFHGGRGFCLTGRSN